MTTVFFHSDQYIKHTQLCTRHFLHLKILYIYRKKISVRESFKYIFSGEIGITFFAVPIAMN